jgi:hypothetical protein
MEEANTSGTLTTTHEITRNHSPEHSDLEIHKFHDRYILGITHRPVFYLRHSVSLD